MKSLSGLRTCLTYSILIILIWTAGFAIWTTWTFRMPLDATIALDPAGRIERDIEIRLATPYHLLLDFSFGSRRAEIMELVSEGPDIGSAATPHDRTGAVVPLRWSLKDAEGGVVAAGETSAHGRIAYGSDAVSRSIAPIRITPGRYRLELAILRDVPEFREVLVRVRLGLPAGNVSWGWQSTFAFFAGLANVLLIWPLAGLLLLVLAALKIRDLTAPGPRRLGRTPTVPAAPAPRSAPPPPPPGTGPSPC